MMMELQVIFCVTLLCILLAALVLHKKMSQLHPQPRLPPSPVALPVIGHLHLLGPNIHQSLHELSIRYGPLFHLQLGSLPCIVVSTPQITQELLKKHELAFSSRHRTTAVNTITYNAGFAFEPYGSFWRYVKKFCTYELLGTRTIHHFEPTRAIEIRRFLQVLMDKAKSGKVVNLSKEIFDLTNNVICRMMLSIRCSDTEDEAGALTTIVREATQIFGEFNISDIIMCFRNFDLKGTKRRSKDIHKRFNALLEKIMKDKEQLSRVKEVQAQDREGSRNKAKDFLEMLMDAMESETSEEKLTPKQVKALIVDFFTAGTDTTTTAIDWAIAELINNPRVLNKAQQEIDRVIGHQRLVQESDASHLPYVQAIIKETLRLHPPIPILNRKSVNECTVCTGYTIPANTILFVNIWSMGRDPEYWVDPLQFTPERFLCNSSSKVIDVKGHNFELLPFGTGRRACPGMLLALQELHVIVATLIQMFDFQVINSDGNGNSGNIVDMTENPGLTVPRAKDLVCCLVPRNDPSIIMPNGLGMLY